jgi:hypothetical protein
MILDHITESITELRLPASIDQTSRFDVVVQIRDTFGCTTEIHLPLDIALFDFESISKFIDSLQESKNNSDDPIFQSHISGNHNTVGQLVTSISAFYNEINHQIIEQAVRSKCT